MSDQIEKQKEIETYEEEERRRREREKEKQKEEKKERTKPKSKIIAKERKASTYTEKVKIPIVKLDKIETEVKEIEVDSEIPEIEKEEVEITVPIIELEKQNIELKQIELDTTLPKITPQEREMKIPIIRVGRPRTVVPIITTFDKRLPQIKATKTNLRVPIYRISKPAIRETISSFDTNIDTQILQSLVTKRDEKVEVIEKVQTIERETLSTEGEPSGGEEYLEELSPDIVDFVFGVPNSKISSKGPKIILYKELENGSTIGSFETLCIRVYREKEGGHPKIQPIKKLDEFNIREIEKWVEADKRIVTIDLDSNKNKTYEWFCKENIREPLRKAIVGSVGFIIFKTRDEKLYEYAKRVLEDVRKEFEHPLDIIYTNPKSLSFEMIKEISSLAWGNINLDNVLPVTMKEKGIDRPYGSTFDDVFNKISQEVFKKLLEKLEKERNGLYIYATNQHEGDESDEHFLMKCFIVKLLSKERKLMDLTKIKEVIKTEEKIEGGVIPDVCVGDTVYEIETLFAEDREGKIPKKKIEHTITKYENVTSIREINIVLDNLTFLRHFTNLIEINKVLKNWAKEHGKVIRFYTLDLQNDKLISLKEVSKKIKNLYMPAAL